MDSNVKLCTSVNLKEGNAGKFAFMSVLTLFESRYTLKGRYYIVNVGKTASAVWVCLLSLNQDIHWREGTALFMLAKLLLQYEYAYSLWIKIYIEQPTCESFKYYIALLQGEK